MYSVINNCVRNRGPLTRHGGRRYYDESISGSWVGGVGGDDMERASTSLNFVLSVSSSREWVIMSTTEVQAGSSSSMPYILTLLLWTFYYGSIWGKLGIIIVPLMAESMKWFIPCTSMPPGCAIWKTLANTYMDSLKSFKTQHSLNLKQRYHLQTL